MNTTNIFYFLKPVLPRRLQISFRRRVAKWKKKRNSEIWPIHPKAAEVPKYWTGWPDKKRFALVLIHDVDSVVGLNNCRHLMEVEKELGLVSSYNFVPLAYKLPSALRQDLAGCGFEVGVHGLTHDGRMFRNYETFSAQVNKINAYLKEWNSVGFTSPSMLCNLRWVADLAIEHSCSSFDTDPFEPRPYGVATVFPFMVSNLAKTKSYVELPYTLPQDHSLFVILKEKDINIWKNKIDYIAEVGGVALLNTHPDYMDFKNNKYTFYEYPAKNYTDFLEHILDKFGNQYWNCLPRDLARFWRTSFPSGGTFDYEGAEITAANRVAIYSKRMKYERKVKLALTCASGGHFEQMQNLKDFYKDYPHFWITDKTIQTEHSLSGESGHFIKGAHFKRPWTYLAQIPRVYKILKKEQPTHMLSTGSGIIVLVPYLVASLLGIRFTHIETFSHVNKLTKMGKLLHKLHQPILSQWENLKLKGVISIGPIITDSFTIIQETPPENIVFVTLGTRAHPFPRIIRAVEELSKEGIIREEIMAQVGHTQLEQTSLRTFDFCSPDEIDKLIVSSKYVITQESAGIVTKCLKLNKRFIVMPRDYYEAELPAKSDMNEDLHYELEKLGYTFVVHDKVQLGQAINRIDQLKTGFSFNNRKAVNYLRNLITEA